MKSPLPIALAALTLCAPASLADEPPTYPLWPKAVTDRQGTDVGDDNHAGDVPTITVYLPPKDKATGASVVICPGGGYGFLATEHEGRQVAEWLNSMGVAGVVLKYRLAPKYRNPAPLDDATRAIRTVRSKAKEWGLDPNRVGILGFSAGGHLASTASTHFEEPDPKAEDELDRISARPDVSILVYPVISFDAPFAHLGSRDNLLGKDAPKDLVHRFSNETRVTDRTPPTFLAHTAADAAVPPENSMAYAMALAKAKVPFELHVFEKGVHGLGLGTGWEGHIAPEPSFQAWPRLCETWLKGRGFLDRP